MGRQLGWSELRTIVRWLPPTGDSAYFRSRKPRSWWKGPEHELLAGVLYAIECGNYQRGGCKGTEPKPIKFPEDRDIRVKDSTELAEKKRAQSEHLKRRREQKQREVSRGR